MPAHATSPVAARRQLSRSKSNPSQGSGFLEENLEAGPLDHRSWTAGSLSVRKLEELIDGDVALPVHSVVQLYVSGVRPNYKSPWSVNEQNSWTGSGFCICGRRIVTNAHCAEGATVLQVQRQDHPRKWRARAKAIAHDLDLAIVEVDDDEFWTGAVAAKLAPPDLSVELYSEVNAIGFPTGGSTLCVTKGVISRFDAQLYAYPQSVGVIEGSRNAPDPVFILQVDSAINPGNSGGPAVDGDGRVVGVASSGLNDAQNVGYVIPISIVHLFLDEVLKSEAGKWAGVSELGLSYLELESDSYRAFLGMDEGATGILIKEVAPLGALHGLVRPGDVLTHIDSLEVSNEGRVPMAISGQNVYVDLGALVTCKPKGAKTTFKLLRKDEQSRLLKTVEISVVMMPVPPLAPRFHGFDAKPEYVVIGGLVFSKGTVPLFKLEKSYPLYNAFIDKYKKTPEHEVVVLVNILRHDINIGVEEDDQPLKSVNGTDIISLAHLAKIAMEFEDPVGGTTGEIETIDTSSSEEYVRICFERAQQTLSSGMPDIVLQRSKIPAANAEICSAHAISHTISPALLDGSS